MIEMRRPNVVVLVINTLKEDYSQGLERLRELGFVKYENAVAPAIWTLPSHVSMVTGLYPSQHGVREMFGGASNDGLAGISRAAMKRLNYGLIGELEGYGYETYIISANPYLSQNFGFRTWSSMLIPGRFYSLNHLRLYNTWVRGYGRDRVRMFMDFIRRGRFGDALLGFIYSLRNYFDKFMHRLRLLDLRMEKGSGLIKEVLSRSRFNEPFFMLINIMEAHSPYLPDDAEDYLYNNAIADWLLNHGASFRK